MSTAAHSRPPQANQAPQPSGAHPVPSAEERIQQAVTRIEASRSALILCLAPEQPAPTKPASRRAGAGDPVRSFAESLATRIERKGLVQGSWRTLRAMARRWWVRQPWHRSVDLVGQTLMHQARPLMHRHPVATLAVGTALGAGLVAVASAARPWAWQQLRRQASPWGDRIGGLLWTQATSAPVQMALASALAAWLAEQGKRHTQQHASTASSEPPGTTSKGQGGRPNMRDSAKGFESPTAG
jgi:hypothetical protein